ncbi:MAG TPA: L,D-transpeptidase [Vicinamibacterales bacterium]|nr:L,D-transpeptidase [Vicinamibacterales bacterium]
MSPWTMAVSGLAVVAALASPAPPPAQRQSVPALPALELQVLLARQHFSVGEIDGRPGHNTSAASAAFAEAKQLPAEARSGAALLEALGKGKTETIVEYTITAEDVAGPFTKEIPADLMAQAKLEALGYTSALEALGERLHASPSLLRALNRGAKFVEGETLRVPNTIGIPAVTGPAVRLVVSKSEGALRAYDGEGALIYFAPVTSGSARDPLPIGTWKVTAIARNPPFHYNPDLFWDADPTHSKAKIAPGPNNPVGVVWIDISKEHYGIHGTPEPGKVGQTASHGCVRLTNWDAGIVAGLVKVGTPIFFEE